MFHIGTIPAENFPRDLHGAAATIFHMLQEIPPLNRLAQAVAAAERADKRLLEKPLNDLVTEIKVRGLIAKMVLVTAQQTLRALPMAVGRGREVVEPTRQRANPKLSEIPIEKKDRYSKREAAVLLNLGLRSLNYRIQSNHIKTKKDGRRRYITQAEIDRYKKSDHPEAFKPTSQQG
jgi:hypothetical protein